MAMFVKDYKVVRAEVGNNEMLARFEAEVKDYLEQGYSLVDFFVSDNYMFQTLERK